MNSITLNVADNTDPHSAFPCFENLVALHQPSLFQFALSLTRCEADAWDLTQHTFYTLAAKGSQLRDDAKVKTWMFTTLHRAFLQICRKQTRFPHFELDEVDAELPNIAPEIERADSAQVLHALEQVDRIYRAPLVLFYLEDKSYKEIGRELNVPLGTIKSRIARGIIQLRKILAGRAGVRPSPGAASSDRSPAKRPAVDTAPAGERTPRSSNLSSSSASR